MLNLNSNGELHLVLTPDEALDPESRQELASKIVDVVAQLTAPSIAGFAFSNHHKIELKKLLTRYEVDRANFNAFGSKNPDTAAMQLAAINARIELLEYLLTCK